MARHRSSVSNLTAGFGGGMMGNYDAARREKEMLLRHGDTTLDEDELVVLNASGLKHNVGQFLLCSGDDSAVMTPSIDHTLMHGDNDS